MATSLGAQLADLRSRSSHQSASKAQKIAHSKSLLFEREVAAHQSFDVIFRVCVEGFEDLCRLDRRFSPYATSLFSSKSILQDRSRFSHAENEGLNSVLNNFLTLIGSKLRLRSALMAVEWLIRRFSVHTYNSELVIVAFLPHHDQPSFRRVLQLLPAELPTAFRFLLPYRSQVKGCDRSIIDDASHNRQFITILSSYTLQSCRLGYQYPLLLSLWASIVSQGIVKSCRDHRKTSGRCDSITHDETLSKFLPILSEALSLKDIAQLHFSSYTALSVLTSSTELDDQILDKMMEAIASKRDRISRECLMCMASLASRYQDGPLPQVVIDQLLATPALYNHLSTIDQEFDLDKLVLELCSAIMKRLQLYHSRTDIECLKELLDARKLSNTSRAKVTRLLQSTADIVKSSSSDSFDLSECLRQMMYNLEKDDVYSSDTGTMSQPLLRKDHVREEEAPEDLNDEHLTPSIFQDLAAKIPSRTAYEMSFLSHSKSFVFGSLEELFANISYSPADRHQFSELAVLRKSLGMKEPLFVSFFVKVWCNPNSTPIRTAAIEDVTTYLQGQKSADPQFLLPYILFALSDPATQVRVAAGKLVQSLPSFYKAESDQPQKIVPKFVLGKGQLYGSKSDSEDVLWLSPEDVTSYLDAILIPSVEECAVDQGYIGRWVASGLMGRLRNHDSQRASKKLKKNVLLALFSSLCSHVSRTPLYSVKLRLLQILNKIERVGETSRATLLIPVMDSTTKMTQPALQEICTQNDINLAELLETIFGILSPHDPLSTDWLIAFVEGLQSQTQPLAFADAVLQRMRGMFDYLPLDIQIQLATVLLEMAASPKTAIQEHVAETLSHLNVSTGVIVKLFELFLPTESASHRHEVRSAKRRSAPSVLEEVGTIAHSTLEVRIKKLTILLELIQEHDYEKTDQLLYWLWRTFSAYEEYQSSSRGVNYVLITILNEIVSIFQEAEPLHTTVNIPDFRADVVVNFILGSSDLHACSQGILLLGAVAQTFPERVLHSVMPIFTTLNTRVMPLDNEYSTYVVRRTLDSLIPPLVHSLSKRKHENMHGLSELMLSFCAAFEHIPPNWRLDVYLALTKQTGAEVYLHFLIVMLLERQGQSQQSLSFARNLIECHDIQTQWTVIEQYIELLTSSFKPGLNKTTMTLMISQDSAATMAKMISFPTSLISRESFLHNTGKFLSQNNEDSDRLRQTHQQCLHMSLVLIRLFRDSDSDRKDTSLDLVKALLNVLPIHDIYRAFRDILSHPDSSSEMEVLKAMERCLKSRKNQVKADEHCSEMLPSLLQIIEGASDLSSRCIAISILALIVGSFGKKHPDGVIDCVRTLLNRGMLRSEAIEIRIASLCCLTKSVEVGGEALVPLLPDVYSSAITVLEGSHSVEVRGAELCNRSFDCLTSIISHVPWIISESSIKRLLSVLYQQAHCGFGGKSDANIRRVLQLLAGNVDAQICLRALTRTWELALRNGCPAMEISSLFFDYFLQQVSIPTISSSLPVIGDMWVNIIGMRRMLYEPIPDNEFSESKINSIEDKFNGSLVALIKKLKETTFRPLFLRVKGEAFKHNNEEDKKCRVLRRLTFYKFIWTFLEVFKSVATSFATLVIEDIMDVLSDVDSTNESYIKLWQLVLCVLKSAFQNDNEGYYQVPSRFLSLSRVLMDQLSHTGVVNVETYLIPAIVELAAITDSISQHKDLNSRILTCARSSETGVRRAAIKCQRAITDRLGEEWLTLLPEMLPAIGELQEDEDGIVEEETLAWIQKIEDIVGESLDTMLQ